MRGSKTYWNFENDKFPNTIDDYTMVLVIKQFALTTCERNTTS